MCHTPTWHDDGDETASYSCHYTINLRLSAASVPGILVSQSTTYNTQMARGAGCFYNTKYTFTYPRGMGSSGLRHRHWPFAGVSLFLSLHGEKIVIFASKDGSAQRAQRTLRMWTTSAWVPRAHARGGDVTCQSDTP